MFSAFALFFWRSAKSWRVVETSTWSTAIFSSPQISLVAHKLDRGQVFAFTRHSTGSVEPSNISTISLRLMA